MAQKSPEDLVEVPRWCECVTQIMSRRTPHVIFYTAWAVTMVLVLIWG